MINLNEVSRRKLEEAFARTAGLELIPCTLPEVFYVRSADRVYQVVIQGEQAECNCKAGENGLFCKHIRLAQNYLEEQTKKLVAVKTQLQFEAEEQERQKMLAHFGQPQAQQHEYLDGLTGQTVKLDDAEMTRLAWRGLVDIRRCPKCKASYDQLHQPHSKHCPRCGLTKLPRLPMVHVHVHYHENDFCQGYDPHIEREF